MTKYGLKLSHYFWNSIDAKKRFSFFFFPFVFHKKKENSVS